MYLIIINNINVNNNNNNNKQKQITKQVTSCRQVISVSRCLTLAKVPHILAVLNDPYKVC